LNLDWKDHVVLDSTLLRPNELNDSRADPSKAKKILTWAAKTKMREVTFNMVKAELTTING
jgi:GDPmannose 4,6-dehydratase